MRANKIRAFVARATGAMAVGAMVAVPAALAQDGEGLDEVVVQARKFSENLQEVPMSISVITAEEITRQGLGSTEDIARLDPSVIFDYGNAMQDMRVVIRGLSPTRGRVNSAILVDGVDVTSESIQFAGGSLLAGGRLFDLEQVEIVKGPQAALYGRAAFAGAISYRTKDPAKEFGAEVKMDASEEGRYSGGIGFDLPVNDAFGVRVSGTYWNRDSIYQNIALNGDTGSGDGFSLALTSKWEVSENFSARLRLDYSDDSYTQRADAYRRTNVVVAPDPASVCPSAAARSVATATCVFVQGATAPGAVPSQSRLFYWGSAGRWADIGKPRPNKSPNARTGQMFPGSQNDTIRANLNLEWNVGPGTLTSITGYTDADQFFFQDLDNDSIWNGTIDTANRMSDFKTRTNTKQLTEELRYRTAFDGPVNFTIGGEYYSADDENITNSTSVSCFPSFFNCGSLAIGIPPVTAWSQTARMTVLDRAWGRELDHTSFYGMVEFNPSEKWEFEIEGRRSREGETIYGPICNPANDFTWTTPPFTGIRQPCQDASFTPAGSPFPPAFQAPGQTIAPFSVDFPSSILLFSPLTAAGIRQQTSITGTAPEYKSSFTAYRGYALFKATESINLYGTVGRSVKPGGRSTVTAGNWLDGNYDGVYDDTLYGPEKLTSFELGAKMQWFDNRLRTNFAVFKQKYDQKQIGTQTLTPNGTPVGRIINAGKAKIDGLEADIQWRATDNLTLGLAYSYLDAKYTSFKFRSNSPTDAIRYGDCTRAVTVTTPPAGPPVTNYFCDIDALKNRSLKLEDVPEHSLVAQARYERSIAAFGGASFYIEGDSQVQTERFIDPSNRRWVEDYVLANLRIGVAGDRWDAMLYINNLTDDDTILTAQDSPGDVDASIRTPGAFGPTDGISITLPDPRIIGVRFNWRFGGSN